MLVNLNDVLKDAKLNQYAVGLFNTVNLEMAKGVIAAAEETKSPVIIGTAEVLLPYASLEELAYFLIPMAKKATVPVVVHYDHGLTDTLVKKAIELGFSSVMYDCSTLGFDENCKAVADMVTFAHKKGISVEAELGHVGANEGGSSEGDAEEGSYTDVNEAIRYVSQTNVDALAVAIGTAHGAYKSKPRLDFERLQQLAKGVDVPLVLHGGSGLSESDFKKTIQYGISKVNIFTDINCAAAKAAFEGYHHGTGMTDMMPNIVTAIKEATIEKMSIFGCRNKG
ncbi:MAG: class II fructose-bisphosphate aldolase [Hungatella sp.]